MLGAHIKSLAFTLLLASPIFAHASTEKPIDTTVCDLRRNAQAWDHKLVRVKGYVTHGLEESSVVDPACGSFSDGSEIWMEYGGLVGSGTMYFGPVSPRHRTQDLTVEGVPTSLVEDARFERLDGILQSGVHSRGVVVVAATVQGRFFAGRQDEKNASVFRGFGHFGCCSLFVLEGVEEVAEQPLSLAEKEKFAEAFRMVPPVPPPPHTRVKRSSNFN